ncbi:hypothetical protein ACFYRC_06395 [Streptomyces sp. NPDC005279]|uniref:hypothetical protein n=1 Tax=Streptomyces sp. NPDC005279 TaxID=3364712 RepID=UPI0036AC8F86
MKPRLVFVHGIGGPRDAAAELDAWLRALADGARSAGHSRRVLDLVQGWAADARFPYYGDLFRSSGAQGARGGPESDEETRLVGQWLGRTNFSSRGRPAMKSSRSQKLSHRSTVPSAG